MGFLLIALLFLPSISLDHLNPIIEVLHEWCMNRVRQHADQTDIHLALICGERLPFGSMKQTFIEVGLIHLMVVSGAHLLFLEKMMNVLPRWPLKTIFVLCVLVTYALIAELHPPIVRALISISLHKLSRQLQMHWSSRWVVMFSGILSVVIQPQWIQSMSLQLSWIGALAFASTPAKKITIMAPIMSYLLLLPMISQWNMLHPLSIGVNWVLFPVLSITLFPLSVFSFLFPVFYTVTDPLWSLLIHTLTWIQPFLQQIPFYIHPIPNAFRWVYIGFIFFFLQCFWVLFHRMKK